MTEEEKEADAEVSKKAKELAERLRIEEDIAEQIIDELESEKDELELWHHGNAKRFEQLVVDVGAVANDSKIRKKLGDEGYEDYLEKESMQRERMDQRQMEFELRMAEALEREAEWAANEYGEGTDEYNTHMAEQGRRWGNRAPFDFKGIVAMTKDYGMGQRTVKEVLGKPRKIRRMLTAEAALEEEHFSPKRTEAMEEKSKKYKDQPIYSQHKVVFLEEGESFDQDDLEREQRETPSLKKKGRRRRT